MNNTYLSIEEVAKRLHVHSKTIRRYIGSGKLAAKKVAGSWRIEEEDLQEYVDSCEENSCECKNGSVSKDDFCIFMDSEYYESSAPLQVCSIVDYFVSEEQVKNLLKDAMNVVAEFSMMNKGNRFHYVYDDQEKKIRMVFWGTPSFMEEIMKAMKVYEV